MTPQEAYRQICLGDFGCLVHRDLSRRPEYSRAWMLAFRAAGQLVVGTLGVTPAAARSILREANDAEAVALACSDGALAAVLRFDSDELSDWCEVLSEVAQATPISVAALGARVVAGWRDLFAGDAKRALTTARAVAGEAVRTGASSTNVEAVTLEGLALLSLQQTPDGLSAARRASRMARTEGILQREYLANLVLARARRFSGHPHAASRILAALRQVTPRTWRSWLGWEHLLCEGVPHNVDAGRGFDAGLLGSTLFRAAQTGDHDRFEGAREELLGGLRGFAAVCAEAQAVVAALDPRTDVDRAPDEVRGWLRGESQETPVALQGLAIPHVDSHGDETAAAFVVVDAHRRGRLVLGNGLGLLHGEHHEDAHRFSLSRGRTYTALAVLCLAPGRAMADGELFQAVYGFAYVASKHQSTLRVLIHRMRQEAGDAAHLVREDGTVALELVSTLVFPDPRCTPSTEELILRSLASRGGKATLRELAHALSLSPRTVQRAMRTIVDDGACEVVGGGPETSYEFEDTTFHQPTLTRLRHRSTSESPQTGVATITSMLLELFSRPELES